MGKGATYGPERAILRDPRSGLRIIRLTHYATISMNLYFEMCSFTEDDEYVILFSQRYAGRDAPWDLFRARTDGMELVQMTECDNPGGVVVSSAAGCVFYQAGRELRKVDIRSLAEETVAETPGTSWVDGPSLASIDAEGNRYFGSCQRGEGAGVVFKADVLSGKVATLFEGVRQVHIHADPAGRVISFGEMREDGSTSYLIDADGGNLREYPFNRFAHRTWFGDTGRMQGCLLPPGHGMATFAEGDTAPDVLTEGRYYWHSSASRDAQWIVADTNWPREGLYLFHVPSRTVTFVCDPHASCSHPQWTHPHPSLSPGLRHILFNSDMTGIGQVYVVELTDGFLEQAARGHLCKPCFTP